MSRDEMIISALVDLVNAKEAKIVEFETKIAESEARIKELEDILDIHDHELDGISLSEKNRTFTETQLLRLAKVQSNVRPSNFRELFGKKKGTKLFRMYVEESWNLISFMFNKINEEDRDKLLNMVNRHLNK